MRRKPKIRIWIIDKQTIIVSLFAIIFTIIVLSKIALSNKIIPDKENKIKAKTIVIDPGHGGIDGGANKGNILEKNINLDIAIQVSSILKANGANTILTREKDMSLDKLIDDGGSRYKRDLNARTNIINSSNADLFVSIHANCISGDTSESGTMIFYRGKGSPSNKLADNIMNKIHNEFKSLNRNQHSPQIGDYYILRNAKIPGVIIETGFISNEYDCSLLLDSDFKHRIAKAVCLGINDYFKGTASN